MSAMCKNHKKSYYCCNSITVMIPCMERMITYDTIRYDTIWHERLFANSKKKKEKGKKTYFLEDDDAFPVDAIEALLRRFFPAIIIYSTIATATAYTPKFTNECS
jgi:hypothetical protein